MASVQAHRAPVDRALQDLQRILRRRPSDEGQRTVMTKRLPMDLVGGETQHIGLVAEQMEALANAQAALLDDLRFEHLDKRMDDVVWRFAAACHLDRKTDHVRAFIEEHKQEPVDLVCHVPVEYLKVNAETDVLEIRLLPVSDARIPQTGAPFSLEFPVGCVVAVDVRGTNPKRMAHRARTIASHALRVLRVALDAHTSVDDHQVRFRLGNAYAFDDCMSGWRRPDDAADALTLGEDLAEFARVQPVARMPVEPTNDLQRKADLALRWIERASFEAEPTVALLCLFFALEALLGDKSKKLKAPSLAFRQATLSHAVTESFTHPNETYFLYDEVRSNAVHGEEAPAMSWRVVRSFAMECRRTLSQYLTYADQHNLKRRGRLLKALDEHPDRPQLVAWLRQNGGAAWSRHLGAADDVRTG